MQIQPMIFQYDERPQPWQRFLEKACAGSYKAASVLESYCWAIVAQQVEPAALDALMPDAFDQLLTRYLPAQFPLPHAQAFADMLVASGIAAGPLLIQREPMHPRQSYDRLWAQRRSVAPAQLLHDAILLCAAEWGAAPLIARLHTVRQANPNYNSLDAVACMLMLAAAWPNK